ncbi:MAG: Gfo/Idh/MocA family oxidoreductase [Acidobacteria bacterium]|nr:Gfo/Idh/MocA family oxidoreductase [Acidobacteriota bacterium]
MSELERRDFLKSAGAGALLTTPLFTGRVAGANDRIRVGFIGLGRMGRASLKVVLGMPECQVVALCDVYKPNLELAQAMAPEARVYKDFRDLLAAGDIDVVDISTPDHWHAYMTVEACKAGKDVYVEKPICVALEEGRIMVQAARKYSRVVQVGTQQRSGPHFARAREIVRSGRLGKISFVRTWNYGNQYPEGIGNPPDSEPPADLDWDMWLGPAPKAPFNPNRFGVHPKDFSRFRWFWDYAGGMVTDWSVHLIDIVLWAMDTLGPNVITASGGKYYLQDDRETPDTIQITWEFPNWLCVYEDRELNGQSMFKAGYGILFHGTDGTLLVDRSRYELIPERRRQGDEMVDRTQPEEGKNSSNHNLAHWRNFVACIRSRERPVSDIEYGHRSTSMALLGNVAFRSHQRVEWDPVSETTGNKEAWPYLRREYRPPWKLTL